MFFSIARVIGYVISIKKLYFFKEILCEHMPLSKSCKINYTSHTQYVTKLVKQTKLKKMCTKKECN